MFQGERTREREREREIDFKDKEKNVKSPDVFGEFPPLGTQLQDDQTSRGKQADPLSVIFLGHLGDFFSHHGDVFDSFFLKGAGKCPSLRGLLVQRTFGVSQNCRPEKEQVLHCFFLFFLKPNSGWLFNFCDQNRSSLSERVPFQTRRPVCVVNEYIWFSDSDFLLSSVLLWRLCCTGRCDFCIQASTVGVLERMLKATRSKCAALKRAQKQEQTAAVLFYFSPHDVYDSFNIAEGPFIVD